jgi:hypothetical protein
MALLLTDDRQTNQEDGFDRAEVLSQLNRIVCSNHFKNSKRYPSFLRFIVERTVESNTEVLKERNLGTEVFGRSSDYDTGADPIVRVTAGEVRKRIAQYYQTAGHQDELRIDLPLGSYVPKFHRASQHSPAMQTPMHHEAIEPSLAVLPASAPIADDEALRVDATAPASPTKPRTSAWSAKKILLLGVVASVGIALAAFAWQWQRSRHSESGTNYFWQSFTPGSNALIVLGVHFTDGSGKGHPADASENGIQDKKESALALMESSEMVPVSDIVSYSKLTNLLTRRSVDYETKSYSETGLEDLSPRPVILIGGMDNLWTMRLTGSLRFRFVPLTANTNAIVDSLHPSVRWSFDNLQPALGNSRDYAIVASYYDTTIEQHVEVAAGIGMNGTMAAAEFLSSEKSMKNWLAETRLAPNKNVELVLSTEVLDGKPGPPHVIAYYAW